MCNFSLGLSLCLSFYCFPFLIVWSLDTGSLYFDPNDVLPWNLIKCVRVIQRDIVFWYFCFYFDMCRTSSWTSVCVAKIVKTDRFQCNARYYPKKNSVDREKLWSTLIICIHSIHIFFLEKETLSMRRSVCARAMPFWMNNAQSLILVKVF